jgi:hypothetical protein
MSIKAIFGDAIEREAAKMLILSLSPDNLERKYIIESRNRIMKALEAYSNQIPGGDQLIQKIFTIRNFFNQLGGKEENAVRYLAFYDPRNMTERAIVQAILLSEKPLDQCSEKEKREIEEQKKLRDKIIKIAQETASPEVLDRLAALMNSFPDMRL